MLPTQAFERALENVQKHFPDFEYQPETMVNMRMLRTLSASTSAYFNRYLARYDINDTMWYALVMLYSQSGNALLPSELSRILDLTRTSATRLSDELLRRGWVKREASPIDRRSVLLTISESGEKLVEELMPKLTQARMALWENFSEEEIAQVHTLLRKLVRRISEVEDKA